MASYQNSNPQRPNAITNASLRQPSYKDMGGNDFDPTPPSAPVQQQPPQMQSFDGPIHYPPPHHLTPPPHFNYPPAMAQYYNPIIDPHYSVPAHHVPPLPHHHHAHHSLQGLNASGRRIPDGAMTVEELEAQLMGTSIQNQPGYTNKNNTRQFTQHDPQPLPYHSVHDHADPADALEYQIILSQQEKRKLREDRMRSHSRYNGIMSQREKDLIARIQISQLVTADPIAHDYYFQLRTKASPRTTVLPIPSTEPTSQTNSIPGSPSLSSGRHINKPRRYQPGLLRRAIRDGSLQGQIDRIVQHTSKKNKSTEFLIDGALGKIALKTTKNPRQQLNLSSVTTTPKGSAATSPVNSRAANYSPMIGSQGILGNKAARRKALKATEEIFELVLHCEALNLSRPSMDAKPTAQVGGADDEDEHLLSVEEEMEMWERQSAAAYENLWARLQHVDDEKSPIFQLYSVSKGKKLWPRIAHQLKPEHLNATMLDVFMHAHQLDVIRQASIPALYAAPQLFPGHTSSKPTLEILLQYVGEVEDFMQYVLPYLVRFIADAPWSVVSSNLEALMDRGDVYRMGASKVGLAFLTMLVSRSEILNQYSQASGWADLYLRLFSMLQSHNFTTLFPVSIKAQLPGLTMKQLPNALVPLPLQGLINQQQGGTSQLIPSAPEILDFYLTDDAHVWQFLAALAVAATVEQQTVLVTEVRDRILGSIVPASADENAISSEKAERALSNVNILLNALGLDANQIQTAM